MEYIKIEEMQFEASRIILGCMRLTELTPAQVEAHVDHAMALGINYFDHADIYGGGECERLFSGVIEKKPSLREKMILQSKCCIRDGFYDASKEYILASVDGILNRLKTEYLDVLLLHRPDALMEPEAVAEAFDVLERSGKVRHFGVSNHNAVQMALLKKYVRQPLLFNQLQMSVVHTPLVDSGIHVNMLEDGALDRTGGLLDHCRLENVHIQAWSPFQKGFFEGVFLNDDGRYGQLNAKVRELAEKYGVTDSAIAVAWLLRHPCQMQVVVGTTKQARLADCCAATAVRLTRSEWYELYCAAGNTLP